MTAKRFREEMGIAIFIDNQTGKEYSEYNLDEIVGLLNELHEENKRLKKQIGELINNIQETSKINADAVVKGWRSEI